MLQKSHGKSHEKHRDMSAMLKRERVLARKMSKTMVRIKPNFSQDLSATLHR